MLNKIPRVKLLDQQRPSTRHIVCPQWSRCWGIGGQTVLVATLTSACIGHVTSLMHPGLSRGT